MSNLGKLTRRGFLRAGGGTLLAGLVPAARLVAADGATEFELNAMQKSVRLAPEPFPETRVWCYNGQSPGPLLRFRQGEPVRILVNNHLEQHTTVHWHGLRVPNAVDGVPFLTQPPIPPGESFVYEFSAPDAGTYWYHSHANTAEQIGRGLYGPMIIDEHDPISVDRDELWLLDDWRLTTEAQIENDFHNPHDFARAGRVGNTITVNGRTPGPFLVRSGERIRLRLVNAANARIFSLRFQDHEPTVIALDGQPVTPYVPKGGAITLAPAQRVDLILDMGGSPGTRVSVLDTFFPQSPFKLRDIVYSAEAPLRESPLDAPISLPENPIPAPDMENINDYDLVLEGGDLGSMTEASLQGHKTGVSDLFLLGKMWSMNGVAGFRTKMPPLYTFPRDKTCVVHMRNRTAWPHPMHMHGHHFTITAHSGDPEQIGKLRDTVLLGPGETASAAFVADNPGDWLFHCHIVTHAEAGMVAVVRVA